MTIDAYGGWPLPWALGSGSPRISLAELMIVKSTNPKVSAQSFSKKGRLRDKNVLMNLKLAALAAIADLAFYD